MTERSLLAELRLCTALAPTPSGNKKSGPLPRTREYRGCGCRGPEQLTVMLYVPDCLEQVPGASSIRRVRRFATVLAGSPV